MMDAGTLSLCTLVNTAAPGLMPDERLQEVNKSYFEERVVGFSRYFTARGVNEQADLMVRVWRMPDAAAGMYAVLAQSEHDGQYRIVQVQHLLNDDGLKVTDLTLARMEDFYALDTE